MAGVIPWYFLSSLRFSAEMAILLTILLLTHWLAALTLTPAMFAIFKPQFVQTETLPVRAESPRSPTIGVSAPD